MSSMDNRLDDAASRRQLAETMALDNAARSPEPLDAISPEEAQRILHELRVHQIELELQNEELRRAQSELYAARARYFDLYELAPLSYCTLGEKGMILDANLTTATLLGVERGSLIRQPISRFILKEDHDIYHRHRKRLFETGIPQECELRMVRNDRALFWAHMSAIAARDADGAPVSRVVISDKTLLAGYTIDITDRKLAEKANLETLAVLKGTLEATDNGILVVAEDGNVIHSNRRFAELWRIPEDLMEGGDEKALLDHVLDQLVDPQSFLRGVKNWYASSGEEDGYTLEFKDGRVFERSSHPMVIGGKRAGRVWSFRDITERKKAQEALETSERRFRDIAENAQEWIWEVDTECKYTYSSQVVEPILGYTSEEMLQHYFYDFFYPNDRDALKAGALAAIASQQPFQGFINRNVHKDGRTKWLVTSGFPLFDAKGTLVGYRGVDTDITELKQAEETLRQSEERFKLSMDATNDGLWDWNIETDTGYFSPGYYRMLGYEVGAFCEEAHSWEALIHPDDRESVLQANKECIEGQCEHFEVEYRMKTKDGGWRWILGRGKCVARNEHGRALRLVGTHVDITERKRAEEALRESEEKFSKGRNGEVCG